VASRGNEGSHVLLLAIDPPHQCDFNWFEWSYTNNWKSTLFL